MAEVSPSLAVITLNVNELNLSIKRYRLEKWIQRYNLGPKTQFKCERMEKIFHISGNQKKAGVTILIPDKTDFKIKIILRKYYILTKGLIHEEVIKL